MTGLHGNSQRGIKNFVVVHGGRVHVMCPRLRRRVLDGAIGIVNDVCLNNDSKTEGDC